MSTPPNPMSQAQMPAPAMAPNQRRGFLARNWKWLLAAVFVCGLVFVGGFVALIMGAMRSSDVAKEAFARAQSNSLVGQRLGAPITEGWLVGGSINISNSSGNADLSVPISGPKGKATVYVTAEKTAGKWDYSLMQASIEGSGERIDLLAGATAANVPSNPPTPAPQPAADAPSQPAPTDASVALAAAPQPSVPDPTPASDPAQAKPGSVIATAQYSNDPNLRCDVLEVKRISGDVLVVRWRLVNTGTKSVRYDFSWDDFYYIDPAGNKKYSNLTIDGKRILDVWYGELPPGEQRVNWVKYPAPPLTSKRISLNVPKFTPFEDVPIS